MVEAAHDLFVSNRLKEMIRKYAARPERFFSDGQVDERELEDLVTKHISIDSKFKDGRACIKGTSIMVCDIISYTWSCGNPRDYILNDIYRGLLFEEALDAAFAFLMRMHNKTADDYNQSFKRLSLPQVLYQ